MKDMATKLLSISYALNSGRTEFWTEFFLIRDHPNLFPISDFHKQKMSRLLVNGIEIKFLQLVCSVKFTFARITS